MKIFTRLLLFLLTWGVIHQVSLAQCTTAPNGRWPTVSRSLNNSTAPTVLSPFCLCGQYSVCTDVVSGKSYTVTSSVATDYITITDATGTTILFSGTQPLVFVAPFIANIRVYRHVSSACGEESINRTIAVTCTDCPPAPPPPANDECANAVTLVCGGGSISGATFNSIFEPLLPGACASIFGVWYTFVGDNTLTTITSTPSSTPGLGFDHEIHVFSGTCGSLTSLSCTDATTGTETVSFAATSGTNYYIYIAHYSLDATSFDAGIFNIARTCVPLPSNDNCAGATSLTTQPFAASCSTPVMGTTVVASTSNTDCSSGQDDVWYSFTATATSQIVRFQSVTAVTGTVTAMGMNLYTTCGGVGTNCNTAITISSGVAQAYLTGLTAGTTYFLRVWTGGTGNAASFNICIIDPPPAPPNDLCLGATPLTPTGTLSYTTQSTGGATADSGPGVCTISAFGAPLNAVWFSFVQPAGLTFMTVQVDGNTGFDAVLSIINACGVTGNPAGGTCVDNSADGGVESRSLTGLTPGNTYFIQVHDYQGDALITSTFRISVFNVALPIELKSFSGKTTPTSNMLQWETLTEKNVQWHIVERSVDGIKWIEVGRKPGQMDAQSPVKYELEDRAPLAKAYYRLRSVDYDGAENFSNSIVLTRKGEHFGITAAYPSPTKNELTVQFASLAEETVTIQVTDFAGRLVLTQEFDADNGINEAVLQLANLQTGVYLVRISNATATAEPMRIVKE